MAPHRRTRAVASGLTAVLLALGTVACGGSSSPEAEESPAASESESSSSTPSPSESSQTSEPLEDEEYIDQLNAAQQTFTTAAGELNLADPESPRDFQKSLKKLVGPVETLMADLRGITPPTEVADEHERLITTMDDYREAIVENVDGLSGSPVEIKDAAQAIGDASTEFSTEFDSTINEINSALDRS